MQQEIATTKLGADLQAVGFGPKPKKARTIRQTPPLDLDTLAVRYDVPLPQHVPGGVRRGEGKWAAVLSKLDKVGASIELPQVYKKAVSAAVRSYMKRNSCVLRVRSVGDSVGVWRTA